MSEDLIQFLTQVSIWAIPMVLAFTVHEVSHGLVARRYGDRTAEAQGRLSLNPLKHVDPIGTLLMPILALLLHIPVIGWAKPVPINPANLNNPRLDMAKVAAAGPLSNMAQALVWGLVLAVLQRADFPLTASTWVMAMAWAGIVVNVLFAVFNMLPIPPLDGGRVLRSFAPARLAHALDRIEPFGFFILFGMLYAGVLDSVLGPLLRGMQHLVISLSGVQTG